MKRSRLLLAALTVASVAIGPVLRAEALPPDLPLIQERLYPLLLKVELAPLYTYSINDKYTHHTGMVLTAGFHFFNWLGVEAYGGYNLNGFGELGSIPGWPSALRSGWTNLADAIDQFTHSGGTESISTKPLELPDLYWQSWMAGADVVFSPFYGKWSIVSELGGSFYFYGVAGGGAAGTEKKVTYPAPTRYKQGPVVFPLNYGIGAKIFFLKWLALRAELRDYWWINPEVEEIDQSGVDPCKGGYCLTVDGKKQQFTDTSRMTMLQVGLSFVFP